MGTNLRTTTGCGSNGEVELKRDAYKSADWYSPSQAGRIVCREIRDCNSGRLSKNPSSDGKTGYVSAQDNRQVPHPPIYETGDSLSRAGIDGQEPERKIQSEARIELREIAKQIRTHGFSHEMQFATAIPTNLINHQTVR